MEVTYSVIVIALENWIGEPISNPEQGWFIS